MGSSDRISDLSTQEKRALLRQMLEQDLHSRQDAATPETTPLPQLTPALDDRYQPFPLTEIQQAYWIGRGNLFSLGNVSAHAYFEFESAQLDLARLEEAWQRLVERHEMLRAVVLPDGRQRIMPRAPFYPIKITDLRSIDEAGAAAALASVRELMSHEVLQADRWPLFGITATRLRGGRTRLHISFDLLFADAWSLQLLVTEWQRLCTRIPTPCCHRCWCRSGITFSRRKGSGNL